MITMPTRTTSSSSSKPCNIIILLFFIFTKNEILINNNNNSIVGVEAFSTLYNNNNILNRRIYPKINPNHYNIKTTICKHDNDISCKWNHNEEGGMLRLIRDRTMRLSTSKISSQQQQQKLSNFHNIAARTIFQTYRSSNSRISTKKIKVVLKFIISSILFLSLSQSTMIKSAISATATTTTSIPTNSILSLSPMSIYKKIILSKMTLKKIGVMLSLLFTTFLTWETYTVQKRQAIDATSEWSRYANNPSARGRAIMLLLVKLLPYTILARISKPKYAHELRTKSGEVAAQNLLQLGPLYIKIGQILSCREDLFSPEWNTALERLQDRVPAQSGDDAIQLAYESFGSKERFDATLSYFDNVPIAAASLGQVHKATLRQNNATVAIKIQRPKLRELYDKDLSLMKQLATMGDVISSKLQSNSKNSTSMQQNFTEIFLDAQTILYREIDYIKEAENTIRFANDFGIGFGGLPTTAVKTTTSTTNKKQPQQLPSAASWLRVPQVYKEFSTEKVLVMEYVPSIKINNYKALQAVNVTTEDREYLANCLARSYLRQLCNHFFFSTDPHPGNLGVEIVSNSNNKPQPRLVFYDFGQACELSKEQGDGILNVIESIMDMNAMKCVTAFSKMGVLVPNADLDLVRRKVQNNFDTGKIKVNKKRSNTLDTSLADNESVNPLEENSITAVVTKTEEVKDKEVMQYFTLPAEYAFVARAITQMDGVGKGLDSNFDFISASAPFVIEIKGTEAYLRDLVVNKYFSTSLGIQSSIFKSLGFDVGSKSSSTGERIND